MAPKGPKVFVVSQLRLASGVQSAADLDRNATVMEDVTLTWCYIEVETRAGDKHTHHSATNHQGPAYQAWRWENNNRTGGRGCFTFPFLHSRHSHQHLPLPNNWCHSQHGYLGQADCRQTTLWHLVFVSVEIWLKIPIIRLKLGTQLQFVVFSPFPMSMLCLQGQHNPYLSN